MKHKMYYPQKSNPGESHPNCKLDEAKVLEIRAAYTEGGTLQRLADEYGVTFSCIWKIIHKRTWGHVS